MSDTPGDKRFAFFDLDLTLVAYDTQLVFCNHVLRAEPWRRCYLVLFAPFALLYGLRLIGDLWMKRIFSCYLWRMPTERLQRYGEEFAQSVLPKILYPEVVAELGRHRDEGRVTVMNTASLDFYAGPVARVLGFDHWFATRVAPVERMGLIPVIAGPNNKGEAKIGAMESILPAGEARPLAGCYAYSDSSADLPLLELAEHPVMVHPSDRLRAAGEKEGWKEMRPKQPYSGRSGRIWASILQVLGLWSIKAAPGS